MTLIDATPAQLRAYDAAQKTLMARSAFNFVRFWFSVFGVAFLVTLYASYQDQLHWSAPAFSGTLDLGVGFAMRQVFKNLFPDSTKVPKPGP